MTTVVVSQIEMQFALLSAAEHPAPLERFVRQSRVDDCADHGGSLELPFEAPFVSPDLQHELDLIEQFRAAQADLLSEIE